MNDTTFLSEYSKKQLLLLALLQGIHISKHYNKSRIIEQLSKVEVHSTIETLKNGEKHVTLDGKSYINEFYQEEKKVEIQIPKKRREEVWNRWIGAEVGVTKCLVCNEVSIQQGASNGWDCGHILSRKDGGDVNVENLRPICKGCNSSMSDMNMIDYCKKYYPKSPLLLNLKEPDKRFFSIEELRVITAHLHLNNQGTHDVLVTRLLENRDKINEEIVLYLSKEFYLGVVSVDIFLNMIVPLKKIRYKSESLNKSSK